MNEEFEPSVKPSKSCVKLDILPTRPSFMTSDVLRCRKSKHGPGSVRVLAPIHFSMSERRSVWWFASDLLRTQASRTGPQSKSVSLT